jgi:hypothetical protein
MMVKRSGRFCKSTFCTAFTARFVFSVESGDSIGVPSCVVAGAYELVGGCGGVSVDIVCVSKYFDMFRSPFK